MNQVATRVHGEGLDREEQRESQGSRRPLRNQFRQDSCLKGCLLNSVKSGQDEVDQMLSTLDEAWSTPSSEDGPERKAVCEAAASLCQELDSLPPENCDFPVRERYFAKIAGLSKTLASFVSLCLACAPQAQRAVNGDASTSGVNSSDNASWLADAYAILSKATLKIICSPIWEYNVDTKDVQGNLSNRLQVLQLRSTSTFLAIFARLAKTRLPQEQWSSLAFVTIRRVLPGDEDVALWIIDEIMAIENSRFGLGSKLGMLLPFFKYMVRPDGELVIAPLAATPESIQKCTTQVLPSDYLPSTASRHARVGLPLEGSWPCSALDHLLRSGTSSILTNPDSVPDSWSASEVDLAQTSLSLLSSVQRSLIGGPYHALALRSDEVVFTCMKVFMLEHNQQQTDSTEEVFRDPLVDRLMRDLLQPFAYNSVRHQLQRQPEQSIRSSSSVTLEDAARSFLGPGTPFYQFYTDFVALYDAVSFGHPTFARMLFPPISMRYALDYRKHLWGDFGHVLCSVQTPTEDVVLSREEGIEAYLWPYETDAEMIGWYLRALIKWPLAGFVRVLAVHHVAYNIWPDLQEGSGLVKERRARMLLQALVNQAKPDVARDVAAYVQQRPDALLTPDCFTIDGSRKDARLALIREWGDGQLVSLLENIYEN